MSKKVNPSGARRKAIRRRLREMRKARRLRQCMDVASFENPAMDKAIDTITKGMADDLAQSPFLFVHSPWKWQLKQTRQKMFMWCKSYSMLPMFTWCLYYMRLQDAFPWCYHHRFYVNRSRYGGEQ